MTSGSDSPADVEFPRVDLPDLEARVAAEERQRDLTKPAASLGRLEELGCWVAACQGVCPPRQFERARVVVLPVPGGLQMKAQELFMALPRAMP